MEIIGVVLVFLIGIYAYTRFSYYFRHQKKKMDEMNTALNEIKEILAKKE